MNYDFSTRQLFPYSDQWKNGMRGALWYIQELDAIYMIEAQISTEQDEYKQLLQQSVHPVNCLAKGFPAALFAHKDLITSLSFNWVEFYQAYFKAMSELFPQKPAYFVPPIVEDWDYTLRQIQSFQNDISGYFDYYQRMHVGQILRDLFNPFKIINVRDKLRHRFYFTTKFADQETPQLICSEMPDLERRIGAPFIVMQDTSNLSEPAKIQVHGFIAAVINLAMCHYWEERWMEYDFTNPEVMALIVQAYKDRRPIKEVMPIEKLSFALPISVVDLCKAYMDAFEPIILKVFQFRSDLPIECSDSENAYTYIYACEQDSLDVFLHSELYQHLTYEQKQGIYGYARRFSEWLVRTYNVTTLSQHRVMNAVARDMPQIQMQINNFVKITRAGDFEEEDNMDEPMKFKYILSDDWSVIGDIQRRIELHLSSPAELRDELRKLHNDGVISLPMDKPTEIIREVIRVWGDKAPKERSFVTTWGRRA